MRFRCWIEYRISGGSKVGDKGRSSGTSVRVNIVTYLDGTFDCTVDIKAEDQDITMELTKQICELCRTLFDKRPSKVGTES